MSVIIKVEYPNKKNYDKASSTVGSELNLCT